jgi:hypothetical protein
MTTTYTHDLRPKFRAQDIACMTPRGVHLDDAAWMCDPAAGHGFADHGNARRVYNALSRGVMPPDSAWPQPCLDTYDAWMAAGFQV